MSKRPQVPIKRRALIARINRAIAPDHQLMITRGDVAKSEMGEFWVRDNRRNYVARKDVDLEAYARELKVLQDYEKLAENE